MVKVAFEGVEAVGPEAAVGLEPGVELGQRLRLQLIPAPLPFGANPYQPGLPKHPQMLGDPGLAQPDPADELAHGARGIPKQIQNAPASGLGQHLERRCHSD
jgi:hypothetical protein